MATLPPLVVQVIADTKKFQAGMASAGQSASGLQKMSAGLKTGLLIAGTAAVAFGASAVKSFLEAERAAFQLNQAVKLSKVLSEDAAEGFMAQANALQSLTGFQDEAIMEAQAIYTRFKLNADQISRLTELTLDYARATGQDAVAAAGAISKALLGNTRALKTVGIDFKATGDRAQDVADIMTLLDQAVGGTAEEFGLTLSGQMEIAQAHFDEFKETVGSIPATIYDFVTNGAKAGDIISGTMRQMAIDAGLAHEAVEDAAVILRDYELAAEAAGRATGAFAGMSFKEFNQWRQGVVGEVSAVAGAMDRLGGKAHLTADQIIKAFRKQAEALRNYDRNVQILAAKPSIGERMLKFLLDQGPGGIQLINELATTHGSKYREMIASIREAMAADKAHRTTIKGLKNDLQTLPSDIYTTIHINVVGGIPAGIGGGIGGPGPGGQTSSMGGPTFSMPSAGKAVSGGSSTTNTKTLNVYVGTAYGLDDLDRKIEESLGRSIGRWEGV